MLVLTRRPQEKIRIGDSITITILKTKGKAVSLGIEAPPEVAVLRGELLFDREQASAPEEDTGAAPVESERSGGRACQPRGGNWPKPTTPDEYRPDTSAVLRRVARCELERIRGPLRSMLDRRASVGG